MVRERGGWNRGGGKGREGGVKGGRGRELLAISAITKKNELLRERELLAISGVHNA